MTGFDMDKLVPQNAGKLIGRLGALDQSRKDVDRTTRDSESIELIFIDDKKAVVERLRSHRCQDAPADAIDIALDFGVIYEF